MEAYLSNIAASDSAFLTREDVSQSEEDAASVLRFTLYSKKSGT